MTTLTKYQPALTYEAAFDITDVVTQRLYVTVKRGNATTTKNQYVRTCMGTTPEEVLYTVILFKNTASNLGQKLDDKEALPGFLTILGPSPRAVYQEMLNDKNLDEGTDLTDPFAGNFEAAIKAFIATIVEDPQAKESTLAAFGDGRSFVKPTDTSVKDHHERIVMLCNYVDLLPGTRESKLTRDEKRNIFFNSFPSSWKESFKRSAHDVTTSTVQTIKEWMSMQKRDADKDHQKRKKERERKDKDKKVAKKGDQSGGSVCRIHGGHKWKVCRLNPRSPNFDQAALDRHRANNGGRGFQNRGRGGRGFQNSGRGFQGRGSQGRGPPRDQYYQQHNNYHQDQYSNGPPTTINTDQQSYAASCYPAGPPPQSGSWNGNYYNHY